MMIVPRMKVTMFLEALVLFLSPAAASMFSLCVSTHCLMRASLCWWDVARSRCSSWHRDWVSAPRS